MPVKPYSNRVVLSDWKGCSQLVIEHVIAYLWNSRTYVLNNQGREGVHVVLPMDKVQRFISSDDVGMLFGNGF